MTDKQQIKKEVVLQMIWDRHFEWGMEKDLDNACDDIYNDVFVPLLGKARKETAKEILQEVGKVCGDYQWFKNLCKQYGVEVE